MKSTFKRSLVESINLSDSHSSSFEPIFNISNTYLSFKISFAIFINYIPFVNSMIQSSVKTPSFESLQKLQLENACGKIKIKIENITF